MKSIEDIVLPYLHVHNVNNHGWHSTYCEYCGDGSRTKGPRGGWQFGDEVVIYSCFNCGAKESYSYSREHPFSEHMWDVFKSFGIPLSELKKQINEYKIENNFETKTVKKTIKKVEPIDIPTYFYKLADADKTNPIAKKAKKYLKGRGISYKDYPFYLASTYNGSDIEEKIISKSLMNRVIIPFFKNGEMIYYQARALDKNAKKKYINVNKSKSNIIYGFDELYTHLNRPLFITEGFFDAYHVNGISLQENYLSDAQISILNNSPRQKVVIPDFLGDSFKLAEQAIEEGWGICIPDYSTQCKDVSESIKKYGKLATLRDIMEHIYFDFEAQTQLMIKKL
jgi:DNA primase